MINYDLTIMVLTYNRAEYLVTMLDSIKNQTYPNFFVYILDNNSSDNTESVVTPFLKDKRFKYIRHIDNIGGKGNYEYAFNLCETEFLLITHDDDYMDPHFIEKEYSILKKNPHINMVSTNTNLINEKGCMINNGCISNKLFSGRNIVLSKYDLFSFTIENGNCIACPSVMMRYNTIKQEGLDFSPDVGKALDLYMWLRINCLEGDICILKEALYSYRIHHNQDSKNIHYLDQLLRRPVYELLVNEGRIDLANRWNKFEKENCIKSIMACPYRKQEYKYIKKLVSLEEGDLGIKILLLISVYLKPIIKIYWLCKKILERLS